MRKLGCFAPRGSVVCRGLCSERRGLGGRGLILLFLVFLEFGCCCCGGWGFLVLEFWVLIWIWNDFWSGVSGNDMEDGVFSKDRSQGWKLLLNVFFLTFFIITYFVCCLAFCKFIENIRLRY